MKTVKKVTKAVKKAVIKRVSKVKPQDATYWLDRPLEDKDRDWGYGEENWVKDYVKSVDHPHRQVIIDLLRTFEWSYLLEVGCSAGPNLLKIRENFPDKALYGVDINQASVDEAKAVLDRATEVRQANIVERIPFVDGFFDVVLADAVLMYAGPEDIDWVMDELNRVTKKAVLIVDRFTTKDSSESHVWSRNYTKLLEERGFSVTEIPITKDTWTTSVNWQKYGKFFLALK